MIIQICTHIFSFIRSNSIVSDRATTTSTEDVDLLAIDLFATIVQRYEAYITLDATKIIAEKFKSASADEVLLALNVNIYKFLITTKQNQIPFICFSENSNQWHS